MTTRNSLSKKCPYCSVSLELNARTCFSCKRKVGQIDDHGIAKKPFDWASYLSFLISAGVLAAFIWWAFFKDK